ncbi:glycosylphosphatidylinositol-alpha 1,2 mannosyltransferase smp3 [Aspergillus nidulans FGSC A4]|uniref:GPI mannosyltransferase 4 n=1 Tax=Emericella nidulans (strain FGSC A4 / ATCC 38163 / CBS 112.46 / NRRL 194 / M139) TaxID=227321 RepID=SMP3_EMENI|nr:glycosylphosphatidylinositol-alpha 1,2 mannosyltransferase [Aspergillus nidulans FGSC A4]Q5BAX7.2 RecName: Full=GPI mannosyltransferase 4; AltName: Full=GPI mannosyltransferase IV; Short=GPI-MT-IV [Aspergillus nidulans FGSC A4]CBF86568.1 TPA: GPI mannosyltransferase 4 (EC 2.4.1.-)(GPI mannosyltransferase IV)(GPI-MT-IV) [Source:UniProtKB/Swiss-Prot;Acc:Q5BAX7] [Aspergillus nidulans FGSC A4]
MWRRTYLLLLLIRAYFALSPSYIHPDEHFQGLEVFAGRILSYPSRLPWEFTSERPIRSVFPLYPIYGVPISLLKWFYTETGTESPPAELVYYVVRGVMFLLSFVLEDWAVHDLVPLPRHRRVALVLVASSYVTWTHQTHTFSNSLETLLVAWGLVLINRIIDNKRRSSLFSCAILSFICVAGIFNRITFPAFLVLSLGLVVYNFPRRPLSFFSLVGFGLVFFCIAVFADTTFYKPSASFADVLRSPVITPLNNLLYNTDNSNLALHGLHPHYNHFLVNLPQLLGPALVAMVLQAYNRGFIASWFKNLRAASALSATAMLSIFPHQEPRFLIPCVPLLLSCLQVRKSRIFLGAWVIFNATLGFLMGVYHQGGVVSTQLAVPSVISTTTSLWHESLKGTQSLFATVVWWKTYSPPLWLLGDNSTLNLNIDTRDLMGKPGSEMVKELERLVPTCGSKQKSTELTSSLEQPDAVFVVAPKSVTFLDQFLAPQSPDSSLELLELWSYKKHISLDDLDFGSDGVLPTMKRVIGRRGLGVWLAQRPGCRAIDS